MNGLRRHFVCCHFWTLSGGKCNLPRVRLLKENHIWSILAKYERPRIEQRYWIIFESTKWVGEKVQNIRRTAFFAHYKWEHLNRPKVILQISGTAETRINFSKARTLRQFRCNRFLFFPASSPATNWPHGVYAWVFQISQRSSESNSKAWDWEGERR